MTANPGKILTAHSLCDESSLFHSKMLQSKWETPSKSPLPVLREVATIYCFPTSYVPAGGGGAGQGEVCI